MHSYNKTLRRALPALGLFALSGCMVGPDYHRPKLVVPAGYKEAAGWVPAQPAGRGAQRRVVDGVWRSADLDQLEPLVR